MRTYLLCSLVIGTLFLSGCTMTPKEPAKMMDESVKTDEQMSVKETDDSMKKPDQDSMMQKEEKGTTARQIDFTNEGDAHALVSNGPVVYFFKASWCPTCQGLQKELDSHISTLPSGTTIVTVDYDKEKALKSKYAITYQHTLVQIDATGKEVTKWQGGGVDTIKKNIRL